MEPASGESRFGSRDNRVERVLVLAQESILYGGLSLAEAPEAGSALIEEMAKSIMKELCRHGIQAGMVLVEAVACYGILGRCDIEIPPEWYDEIIRDLQDEDDGSMSGTTEQAPLYSRFHTCFAEVVQVRRMGNGNSLSLVSQAIARMFGDDIAIAVVPVEITSAGPELPPIPSPLSRSRVGPAPGSTLQPDEVYVSQSRKSPALLQHSGSSDGFPRDPWAMQQPPRHDQSFLPESRPLSTHQRLSQTAINTSGTLYNHRAHTALPNPFSTSQHQLRHGQAWPDASGLRHNGLEVDRRLRLLPRAKFRERWPGRIMRQAQSISVRASFRPGRRQSPPDPGVLATGRPRDRTDCNVQVDIEVDPVSVGEMCPIGGGSTFQLPGLSLGRRLGDIFSAGNESSQSETSARRLPIPCSEQATASPFSVGNISSPGNNFADRLLRPRLGQATAHPAWVGEVSSPGNNSAGRVPLIGSVLPVADLSFSSDLQLAPPCNAGSEASLVTPAQAGVEQTMPQPVEEQVLESVESPEMFKNAPKIFDLLKQRYFGLPPLP